MRMGASVIERMALCDQVRLAGLAGKGEKMDGCVLEAMGKIEGGLDLVKRTGATMSLRELGGFLNFGDRYTEKRLVEELERADPETAEKLKAGMFVFEDFVLCDAAALEFIVGKAGPELFAQGLAGCGPKEREAILACLAPALQAEIRSFISRLAFGPELSRAAQSEAVALAYRLEQEGRLEVVRGEEAGSLGCAIRLLGRA
jgi:flagellar motor switch protein FliG